MEKLLRRKITTDEDTGWNKCIREVVTPMRFVYRGILSDIVKKLDNYETIEPCSDIHYGLRRMLS